jgi:hypothetical protein
MFANGSLVTPLESRKRLLIAESEINRAHLVGDMAALTAGVRSLTGRARSFGSIASSTAVLVAALAAFHRRKTPDTGAKPSWLQSILKGAGVLSTLSLAFCSRGHRHENKQPNSRA